MDDETSSNIEWLLEVLLDGETVENFTPSSRMEEYLKAILLKSGTDNLPIPRSRIDALLYQLAQSGESEVLQPQTKTVTPTLEAQTITADEGYVLSKVNVEAATDVYEQGKQSQYDAFWDAYQNNGNRANYIAGFSGYGWNTKNFYPKYDIVPNDATRLFGQNADSNDVGSSRHIDLVERLAECGVTLDFSKCVYMSSIFEACYWIKRVGVIDIRKASSVGYMFRWNYIYTIDKIIVDENSKLANMFTECSNVKNITFEGYIGASLSIAGCKNLTVESAKNIILNNVPNYAGTEKEGLYSLKFHANVWAALNAEETPPSGATWQEYVESLGWTT